jgi:hypothetical protein
MVLCESDGFYLYIDEYGMFYYCYSGHTILNSCKIENISCTTTHPIIIFGTSIANFTFNDLTVRNISSSGMRIFIYILTIILAIGTNIPLGLLLRRAEYIFNNSLFDNFDGSQGYCGGVVMFASGYSGVVSMENTNFTNIVIKV